MELKFDHSAVSVGDALRISKERQVEIAKLVIRFYNEFPTVSETVEALCKILDEEELIYAMLLLGAYLAETRQAIVRVVTPDALKESAAG